MNERQTGFLNGSRVERGPDKGHGITLENEDDKKLSRFEDLLIKGCHFVPANRSGI
jgi:hypothetical protein